MTEEQPQEEQVVQPQLPPIKLAFILDGEIVDILHTDERLGAIFTSNPTIVNITQELMQPENKISVGTKWDYSTEQFIFEE